MELKTLTKDPLTNLTLDTLEKNKQAIVFVNTKPSAEKTAEDLSKKVKIKEPLLDLSSQILKAVSSPTKQCKRLAESVKRGVAFHHSGLTSKQRDLIEDSFKRGDIKVICATPTLAAGVDMPAFRAIIRDLRRYGSRGLQPIPVLEYLQMAGRAGRPSYDSYGEAICIASTDGEFDSIVDTYIFGEPEDIYSKLAVEPVLRTYTLSLIATNVVRSEEDIINFFSQTFWAYQFKDLDVLAKKIRSILGSLVDWEFLVGSSRDEFVSADELHLDAYSATALGRRVAQLYLDPLTAHEIVEALNRSPGRSVSAFSLLHTVCDSLEMRPLLRIRSKELDSIQERFIPHALDMLKPEPSLYDPEHERYMDAVKTAFMLSDWVGENTEEYLMDSYNVRPGELRAKIETSDWLLYSSEEFARLLKLQALIKEIKKLRLRLKYGVKEELLPLLQLKQIGRVRARILFSNKIRDLKDVKKENVGVLAQLIGASAAKSIKEQVGEKVDPADLKISPRKRKGQMSLAKY